MLRCENRVLAKHPLGAKWPQKWADSELKVRAVVAMGTTTFGASKISRLDIPRFFRGIVGAVLGFGIELVSILVATQITAAFVTGNPSDITVWLANFRLFNIPILI